MKMALASRDQMNIHPVGNWIDCGPRPIQYPVRVRGQRTDGTKRQFSGLRFNVNVVRQNSRFTNQGVRINV